MQVVSFVRWAALAAARLIAATVVGAGVIGSAQAAQGPVSTTENVEARLVSSVDTVTPGATILVGLHKIIRPHWHTYWSNPGDAGEPTRITFSSPDGVVASDFFWPTPNAISIQGILTNYGYEGDLLLPLELTVPDGLAVGDTLRLEAHATWLVCEEICIPEEVNLSLALPVADAAVTDTLWGPELDRTVAAAPRPSGFAAGLERLGDHVRLTITDPMLVDPIAAGALRNVEFFPKSGEMITHAAPQLVTFGTQGIAIDLEPSFGLERGLVPIDGVLAFEEQRGGGWARRGVEISAVVGGVDVGVLAVQNAVSVTGIGILQAIVFAFLGGIILNLMPCVFPVLSIKALGVIEHAHGERAIARRHGLAFFAGVLTTFMILAVALLGLKALGAEIGWGFQLQSPLFVTAIAVLFFAIGLNLLGVFEVGASLQNVGQGSGPGSVGSGATSSGTFGSFAVGALAVLAASPCTAPFMSLAIPAALTAPAPVALVIFLALGAGFAAPFTLLSFFPCWGRLLPRPGAWMDHLKQFFAFPMFAAAVWLVWVLSVQAGGGAVLMSLSVMTALGFAIWTARAAGTMGSGGGRALRIVGLGVLLGVVALTVVSTRAASGATPTTSGASGAPAVAVVDAWSPERLAELRAEGRPVFVDFTAAWCITCQFNKRAVLKNARVTQAFEATNTAYLTADWTNRDAAIAAELAKYGRAGVPLYLLFPPVGEPIVLSEILTERQVLDALQRASAS